MPYTPEYTTPPTPTPTPSPLASPTAPVVPSPSPLATPTALATVVSPVDPATMGIVQTINDLLIVALPLIFPGIGVAGSAAIVGIDAAVMKLTPWLIAVLQGKQFDVATLRAMQADLNAFGASFPNQPGYVNAFGGGVAPAPGTTGAPGSSTAPVSMTVKIGSATIQISADTFEALLASLVKLGAAVSTSPSSPALTPATA